jgi:hypothetical protein
MRAVGVCGPDQAGPPYLPLGENSCVEEAAHLAVHGGIGQIDPLGELGDAQLVAGEQERRQADALDRPTGRSERAAAPLFSYSGGYYPLKR